VTELKEEITMRHASFFLSALVLVTMLGTAHAAPASIEGSWSGSGIARHQGGTDRIICRVNYGRSTGKSFTVSASCSTGRGNYELSARVASAGTNRYSGATTPDSTIGATSRCTFAAAACRSPSRAAEERPI
jgi:hypothetical protein